MTEIEQLEQAIAALQAQRTLLGDAIIDAGVAPMQAKLAALKIQHQPHAEQRKQVTVLFADISGFTSLSETLDFEEVTDIINALWQRLDVVITAHGGRVDKHIGDAVMALWGGEVAHEDDPERAVRAALAMQGAIQEFAATLTYPLQMRIGLNTGPVLLSQVGTVGEFTAMGDTVNVASRLEHAAPLGGVLISHATYRHIRGIFEVQTLAPIMVKGKAEPVQVYLALSARPRAFRLTTRGVEGIETRMVGREAELQHLRERFQQATQEAVTQLVTVVGNAGVGKSRLLYEFTMWLELLPHSTQYFKGRAAQQSQAIPYALLRDLCAAHCAILESDSMAIVQAKLEQSLSQTLSQDGTLKAQILGVWLGYTLSTSPAVMALAQDARQLHERALDYLSEFFSAVAGQTPTVILLEDIHWADDQSLAALDHVVQTCPNLRLFVLCLARPDLSNAHPAWGSRHAAGSQITLHRLSSEHSRQMVGEILQKVEHVPPEIHDLIVQRAEGNPFFIEELLKVLIEEGMINTASEPWQIRVERLDQLRVPATLTGVLQARLDMLPGPEKLMLQRASVIGRTFWEEVVALLGATGEEETNSFAPEHAAIPSVLIGLRSRELIFQRTYSVFEETPEYVFKHALLRDVTYESVLKRNRRIYHGQIASWLETVAQGSGRTDEYAGVIAEHYDQAGATQQAAQWYERAGTKAQAMYATQAAIDYFSRALSLCDAVVYPPSPAVHRARGLAYETLGNFDHARADHETALHLASTTGAGRAEWQALLDLGALWAGRDYTQTGEYYRQALALARTINDPAAVAQSLNRLGNWYVNRDDAAQALGYHQEALAIFQAVNDLPGIAATFDLLAVMSRVSGNMLQSKTHYEAAITLYRQLEDRRGLLTALSSWLLTSSTYMTDSLILPIMDEPLLIQEGEQTLTLARELGWRPSEAFIQFILAASFGSFGDYSRALGYGQEGLALAQAINHHQWTTASQFTLGMIYLDLLNLSQAQQYLEQAWTLAHTINSAIWIQHTTASLAGIYLARPDAARAKSLLETELSQQAKMQSPPGRRIWCKRAEVALAEDNPELALDIIDQLIAATPNFNPDNVIPRLWQIRAEALAKQGQLAEAAALLQAAAQTALTQRALPLLWRIQRALSQVYHAQGATAQAAQARRAAQSTIEKLAVTIQDDSLRTEFLHAATAPLVA